MKSKLSLHIMNWDPPDKTNEVIERIQPRVIKVMDSGLSDNKIEDARRVLPAGAIVVGRVFFDNPPVPTDTNLDTYNPAAAAQATFDMMRQDIDKMGWRVDVWEGWNEFAVDENGPLEERHRKKAKHFSDFTIELAELLRKAGRDHAAYSFSTGNPNHLEIWELLEPGVMASKYLALHEYIYPGEDYQNPDMSMCLRHRKVYESLSPAARAHVQMIITECGADLHGVPGAEGGGYKKNIGDEKYWQWLRDYNDILLADPYVLGATIYTYGANRDWVTYDISGSFANLMQNRIPELPDVPEPAPPAVPAPPILVAVPKPEMPPEGLLRVAQVREHVADAIRKLEARDAGGARDILARVVNPWFYATAPEHSTDLEGATAHTTARWYSEEATRRIEAGELTAARDLLRENVLPWLESAGPSRIGVLGVEEPVKKKTTKKSTRRKTPTKKAKARKPKKKKT
jgi:hypothetical protein